MESTLPPCPYKALGVPKDADAALIKSTYRKLALKCHPDKVTDESLKAQKQEEFHKIQQAYELIGDEDKRARYDAEVKLEQLRKEKFARSGSGPGVEVKTGRYEVRTQAPAGATFTATTAHRYEEHKPSSRQYDDRDRYYEDRSSSSRKYDTYEAYPKHSSTSRTSRSEKDPPIRVTRVSSDRTRSDKHKTRDREERRDRENKRYVSVESDGSSADEKARYEQDYRRRSDDARKQKEEEEIRRQAAEARRKATETRRDPRYEDPYNSKMSNMANDAVRYIHRSKVEAERPSPSRTSSSRDARPSEYYDSRDSRSRRDRPETVRRSSARPKDRPSSSGRERDRNGGPEIVEWGDDERKPSFKHSASSPAEIHVPRATPQRSYTESSRDHRRTDTSPTPVMRRSETVPTVPHASSSSRRKEPTVTRPSGLRSSETVTPLESGSSSPDAYPTIPPAKATSTKYYYPSSTGGVRLSPEDIGVANGHRVVSHEPGRSHRTRSPSPLSRPPMGANRHVEANSSAKYTTAAPKGSFPPPLGRSATMNVNEERGRSRLYGEVNSDYLRREDARRQTSFSPDKISYSQRFGPEDIRWSGPRGRDEGEYVKPSLSRHATYVY